MGDVLSFPLDHVQHIWRRAFFFGSKICGPEELPTDVMAHLAGHNIDAVIFPCRVLLGFSGRLTSVHKKF